MKLLHKLKPEFSMGQIYTETRDLILRWNNQGKKHQNSLLNYYYLKFLDSMGLFHPGETCIQCNKPLTETDKYHFNSGSSCCSCLSEQIHREEETLPNEWVLSQINRDHEKSPENIIKDIEYRQRILNYIDYAL
jgi:recombinational DNA repair protein (RecF pathway)